MAVYLVDFENVHEAGLEGIEKLTENDSLHIFFGMNTKNISYDLHIAIHNCKAIVNHMKMSGVGKNYLDFYLATHLGYLIGSEEGPFYIISKDGGFISCLDYATQHGIQVMQFASINDSFQE